VGRLLAPQDVDMSLPEGMVCEYQVDQCGKAVGPQDVDDSVRQGGLQQSLRIAH
jgi:hypothetical protein